MHFRDAANALKSSEMWLEGLQIDWHQSVLLKDAKCTEFTPLEMRLQRVKKKFLKNSLRQEVVNSPQPFSSSCSSLYLLHSMGGLSVFFKNGCFFEKTDVWGLAGRGSDRPKSRVSPGVSRWEGLCWEPKP